MTTITKVVLTIYGAFFAALGIGFWVQPDFLAQRFNLEATNLAGLSTLRADLGGLFISLAALILIGVWARRRSALIAALMVLGAIAVGRLAGWALAGTLTGLMATLAIEVGAVLVLALHVRGLKAWPGPESTSRPTRALIGGGIAAIAIVALGGAAVLNPQVQQLAFEQAAKHQIERSNADLMKDDALRVAICGSSAPLPSHDRAKACVAVIAGGKYYIVDAGPESVENLIQWGIPLAQIGGVLITHFHSDHIGDLGELNLQTWAQGRPAPLAVYGGPGVDQVVAGFDQAYRLDQGYRTAHHTPQQMPAETWPMLAHTVALVGPPTPALSRTGPVLKDGALTVTAIELDHMPVAPAYAYRFDYKGRSVVITGDTKAHAPLAAASRGVDVMVSEGLSRPMIATMEKTARAAGRDRVAAIMHDVQSYHVAPTEAADIANKAGAKLLVLYHLLPAPDNFIARKLFAQGMNGARHGDWTMADDGSLYTLPLDSNLVRIGRVPE